LRDKELISDISHIKRIRPALQTLGLRTCGLGTLFSGIIFGNIAVMKRSHFLFVFILACATTLLAQQPKIVPPSIKWEYSYEQNKENKDQLIVKLSATIEKGWHIYSQDVPADGPVATSFKFNAEEKNYSLIGKVEEPAAEKKMDEAFGAEIKSFEDKVTFIQKIKRNSSAAFTISGELEYMTCNNSQCFPPKTVPISIEIR
jgi:hypothetical protein